MHAYEKSDIIMYLCGVLPKPNVVLAVIGRMQLTVLIDFL